MTDQYRFGPYIGHLAVAAQFKRMASEPLPTEVECMILRDPVRLGLEDACKHLAQCLDTYCTVMGSADSECPLNTVDDDVLLNWFLNSVCEGDVLLIRWGERIPPRSYYYLSTAINTGTVPSRDKFDIPLRDKPVAIPPMRIIIAVDAYDSLPTEITEEAQHVWCRDTYTRAALRALGRRPEGSFYDYDTAASTQFLVRASGLPVIAQRAA